MDQFNPTIYLLLNEDLSMGKFNTVKTAPFHFQHYGNIEGRPFRIRDLYNDFRPEYYNTFNLDLQKYKMKPIDLSTHFLNKGRYENRTYKPPLSIDCINLYTDNLNYSRAEYFENVLKSLGINCKIVTDGILNMNELYILFTHRQIKLYPFYFILCLDNYDVPEAILELSSSILVENTQYPETIKKYMNKVYLTSDSNELTDGVYLMKRILYGNHYPIKIEYKLDKDKIYCLTQLEHQYRYSKFIGQKYVPENIEYIVGLKHPVPWMGMCMAYKEIMMNAINLKLPHITICHDDIVFNQSFKEKYAKIIENLEKVEEWDMFVGLLNTTDPYFKLLGKLKVDDMELLQVESFSNASFVIYNHTMFDKIAKWETKYRKVTDDHFIPYLNKNYRLKIFTIHPFLVEYNYDVGSTISRGKKNELEMNKIRICENIILNKKIFLH